MRGAQGGCSALHTHVHGHIVLCAHVHFAILCHMLRVPRPHWGKGKCPRDELYVCAGTCTWAAASPPSVSGSPGLVLNEELITQNRVEAISR